MTTTIQIDWREFFDRLEDGSWTCSGKSDRTASRKILASMGVSADHIEECLALFEEHGGYCDCEVVMNAQEGICPEWSPTGVTFLIAPGACPEDPAQERLLREHEAEADRRGAEFWNYGWGQSDYGLASKTTAGVLASQINPETMEVTHTWGT